MRQGGSLSLIQTPVDPEKTIGSLIITLPYPHTGGELKLTHKNQNWVFSSGELFSGEPSYTCLAFYSDCVHEVLPVTSGTRVTITCSLDYAPEEQRIPPSDVDCECATDEEKIQKALDELVTALKEHDKTIGLVLDHKYTQSAMELGVLKGIDKYIADRLKKEGFDLQMKSVLFHTAVYAEYDSDACTNTCVYLWGEEDFKYDMGLGPKPEQDPTLQGIEFYRIGEIGQLVDYYDDKGAAYTGNDCRPEAHMALYWNAALIVRKFEPK